MKTFDQILSQATTFTNMLSKRKGIDIDSVKWCQMVGTEFARILDAEKGVKYKSKTLHTRMIKDNYNNNYKDFCLFLYENS